MPKNPGHLTRSQCSCNNRLWKESVLRKRRESGRGRHPGYWAASMSGFLGRVQCGWELPRHWKQIKRGRRTRRRTTSRQGQGTTTRAWIVCDFFFHSAILNYFPELSHLVSSRLHHFSSPSNTRPPSLLPSPVCLARKHVCSRLLSA